MFDLVKVTYHNRNIYSEGELDKILGAHSQVTLTRLTEEKFKNFEDWLKDYYTEPKGTQSFHIFDFGFLEKTTEVRAMTHATATGDGVVYMDFLPLGKTRWLSKNMGDEEQKQAIKVMYSKLTTMKSPGITPQKQNELFIKWRKIVPEKYWDQTCPKPSDEVIEKFKEKSKEKGRERPKIKQLKKSQNNKDKGNNKDKVTKKSNKKK